MRAVLIDASDRMIEERRSKGLDKLDECWEGVWHIVNPPKYWHTRLNTDLLFVLGPLAAPLGLRPHGDATGVFGSAGDWRVPDQAYARPDAATDDGLSTAELVVEVRSPADDTYDKLPFYAERGIAEVLVIHEDRRVELYRRRDDGAMVAVETEEGAVRSSVLGATFTTTAGPLLRVDWQGGSAEV